MPNSEKVTKEQAIYFCIDYENYLVTKSVLVPNS